MFISRNKSLSFKADLIYRGLNISKIGEQNEKQPVVAQIVELNQSDDWGTVCNMIHSWKSGYMPEIGGDFLRADENKRFLALEVQDGSSLEQRIKSIASLTIDDNSMNVDHLQSAPDAEHGGDERRYYGAGHVLLGGVVKQALDQGLTEVTLESKSPQLSKNFYERIAFPLDADAGPKKHKLTRENMGTFIYKTENKYGVKYNE